MHFAEAAQPLLVGRREGFKMSQHKSRDAITGSQFDLRQTVALVHAPINSRSGINMRLTCGASTGQTCMSAT